MGNLACSCIGTTYAISDTASKHSLKPLYSYHELPRNIPEPLDQGGTSFRKPNTDALRKSDPHSSKILPSLSETN